MNLCRIQFLSLSLCMLLLFAVFLLCKLHPNGRAGHRSARVACGYYRTTASLKSLSRMASSQGKQAAHEASQPRQQERLG